MHFDCVIHNAAWVHHLHGYHQLKASNVLACDAIVELVAASSPAFIFVSTVSATCYGAREDLLSVPASCIGQPELSGGYGQSKWVAERRLAEAQAKGAIRSLTIARLGLVGPSLISGHQNKTDWVHRFMDACIAVKASPMLAPMPQNMLSLIPVDVTAVALVEMEWRLLESVWKI